MSAGDFHRISTGFPQLFHRGQIELELPFPVPALSPNSRAGWQAKARAVKRYRQAAGWAALDASQEYRARRPRWQRSNAAVKGFLGYRMKRPDRDNFRAMLKPVWDGLEDAGIVANDRELEVVSVEFERTDRPAFIRVLVWEISTGPTTTRLSIRSGSVPE